MFPRPGTDSVTARPFTHQIGKCPDARPLDRASREKGLSLTVVGREQQTNKKAGINVAAIWGRLTGVQALFQERWRQVPGLPKGVQARSKQRQRKTSHFLTNSFYQKVL